MQPPKKQTKTKGQSSKSRLSSYIEELPVEILSHIFRLTHQTTLLEDTARRLASPGAVYRRIGKNDRGPQSPGVADLSFPLYTIAAVCRQWRDIVSSLPEFATRVVLPIDRTDPTAKLDKIMEGLERANSLPLDILVFPKDTGARRKNDVDIEGTHTIQIMECLAPIVPQCRSFVFKVKYSSSLPLISQQFRGRAPHLRVLKLVCEEDTDEDLPCVLPDDIPKDEEFVFPLLTTIHLDGYTFMDACNLPSWKAQLAKMSIDTLTLSNFTAPMQDEEFDLAEFSSALADIGHIRHLTLSDYRVGFTEGDSNEGYNPLNVDSLTVENLEDIQFMTEFLTGVYAAKFCFYHLVNTNLSWESIPPVHHLRLERIPELDYGFNHAFQRFFGSRLDVVDCEHFSDSHLDTIANFCEPLRRLYLIDCPGITAKGLKAMITSRNKLVSKTASLGSDDDEEDGDGEEEEGIDSDAETIVRCTVSDDEGLENLFEGPEKPPRGVAFRPIHRIHVQGHPKKLSKADRDWFMKIIRSFRWD
ncbi:unnamed protein product [Cyclocybe aegerita]|uniref:F-box domain-containing protein n=1 Tax=Cyclocybe aegerita TaxID=1973307 RepID=A0A8S0WMY2_CYCAE|nr:unnamed protein product [Cyclocybe aegerita]